jgi:hypothetical protein
MEPIIIGFIIGILITAIAILAMSVIEDIDGIDACIGIILAGLISSKLFSIIN